jgi:alkanesulfonate monooxygenase SsuD/methylene tetrahydromethanopterin reductase-like flavin-dependent oxidoreductase (luciferase family)
VQGSIHHVEGAINMPQPVRPGGPPVLVGGGGEKKTLLLTAR